MISTSRKKCAMQQCTAPVYAKKYCKRHQYLRTDKKPYIIRKTAIKKTSRRIQKFLGENKLLRQKDHAVYTEIWQERPHLDFETGNSIPGEPLTIYFHHVLEKRNYPQYRHAKWNIIIVSVDTHSRAESHLWHLIPKVKAYRDQLLKKIENGDLP